MRAAAKMARLGNRLIDLAVFLLVLLMFLFGIYSIWDNWRINLGAEANRELLAYKPTPEHPKSLLDLMELNPDVIGWITVDDTHIDYPLVQGENDMEYVNKDVHGEYSLSGAIFLSCLSSPDLTDPYSLIYGHHMDSGSMFGDVVEFAEERYFEDHRTGTIYLPDRTFDLELFACLKTEASDSVVSDTTRQKEDAEELLAYLRQSAAQYRDIAVLPSEHFVGLSTCSEAVTNGRVILYGRLSNETMSDNGGVSNRHE